MPVLENVTVVEIGQVISAPFAGVILASLGADVLKIERPEAEDRSSLAYQSYNHDKRTLTLDFTRVEDCTMLYGILATTDILIHNLRPGVAETFQLDSTRLCSRFKQLIYCELSAFGQHGPLRSAPGYEAMIQACSGLSSINGKPDDSPVRLGISACDLGTGMWAVIGALGMLERQRRTGLGGVVGCSLLETALSWEAQHVDMWQNLGRIPPRHASGHANVVPYEQFEASDGLFLVCCANDRLFAKLAIELGQPDWVDSPRFATNAARVQNKDVLLPVLTAIFRVLPRSTWLERLQRAGVPSAPIHAIPEAMNDPQVTATGMTQAVPGTNLTLMGLPISFDGTRPSIRWAAPS